MTGFDYTEMEKFRCQLITWGRAVRMSRRLADLVLASEYQPDIIVAIGRGGYVPARIVCDYMLFKDLTSIKIEHWGVAATLDSEAHIRFGLSADITGLKVLLVDDITDTGDTLAAALAYLEKHGPAEVRTAVLQHKTCSSYVPDFYVHRIVKWRWIIYPWAAFEDISGFIKRILADGYISADEIRRQLYGNFQIRINIGSLTDILDHMQLSGLLQKKEIDREYQWKNPD